jgi:hypothetical protein
MALKSVASKQNGAVAFPSLNISVSRFMTARLAWDGLV